MYNLDMTVGTGRKKVREEFQKNSHVRDPRVIDMLVIKVSLLQCAPDQYSLHTVGKDGTGRNFQHVQTEVTCHEIL